MYFIIDFHFFSLSAGRTKFVRGPPFGNRWQLTCIIGDRSEIFKFLIGNLVDQLDNNIVRCMRLQCFGVR